MKSFFAMLLALTLLIHPYCGDEKEDDRKIVVRIEENICTIAASDETPFSTIRSVITALKSREGLQIQVTDEQPDTIKVKGQYLQFTWRANEEVFVKVTGETKYWLLSTIRDQLADVVGKRTNITVLPNDSVSDSDK